MIEDSGFFQTYSINTSFKSIGLISFRNNVQYRVLPPSCLTGALCSIRVVVREDEGVQTNWGQLAPIRACRISTGLRREC